MDLLKLFAAGMSAGAAAMDILSGKVPNRWSLSILLGGLVLRLVHGPALTPRTAAGILLPFLLLFPLFYLRMLGAGDIKLFCALGSLLDLKILPCMVCSFLIGGLYSLLILLLHKNLLQERLVYLQIYLRAVKIGIRPPSYRQDGPGHPENIPFAAAILGSILFYVGGVY